MKVQLFSFNNAAEVRTMRDENGEFWFVAKDVCAALEHTNHIKAIADLVDEEDVTKMTLKTKGGNQRLLLVNESGLYALIFGSRVAEAKVFKRWVTKEVLPTLRKTGSYSLQALVLGSPTGWSKTFPDEFMRQVLKLYGYEFDRKRGTPGFVGHFINKYVYNTLDKRMSDTLKAARTEYAAKRDVSPERIDEVAFLHQFLNTDGKEALREHLVSVTTLAKGSSTIEGFDGAFQHIYADRNQLELRYN